MFWPRSCGLMLAACCLYIRACGLERRAEYVQVGGYDGADICQGLEVLEKGLSFGFWPRVDRR